MNPKALFLPSLAGGGAERVMVNLANGFVERGKEVDMVLAKAEGPYLSQLHPAVRVVDLGAPRVLAALPALARYLRKARPTAILSALDHANVAALLARRLAGVETRVVVSVHSLLSQSARQPNAKEKWLPHAVRLLYPQADAVVAVSQGVADDLKRLTRLPRGRVQVIYNPVVTPELFERARAPLDHPWFAPGAPPVVLGAGRLARVKNFPLLIRAFAKVRADCSARLVILGEGEERGALESLISELGLERDVWLPGWVSNPYAFMAEADVFVLSSLHESLSLVLVEALSLKVKAVATDCGSGPAEVLGGGKYGRLVPNGNVEAMSRAITEALASPVNNLFLKERLETFSVETGVKSYLRLLEVPC